MKKKVVSPKNTMTSQDWEKWTQNVLIFSTPALIIFLGSLAQGDTIQESSKVLYLALINAAIDFLKKYKTEVK